jgi:hypothetical protein
VAHYFAASSGEAGGIGCVGFPQKNAAEVIVARLNNHI